MVDEVLGQKYGDPFKVAQDMFKHLDTPELQDPNINFFKMQLRTLFSTKMDVINDEFDDYLAALVAQNMFEEYIRREKIKDNLTKIDTGHGVSQAVEVYKYALNSKDHLLYLNTLLGGKTEDLEEFLMSFNSEEKIKSRVSVTKKCEEYLKKLRMPKTNMWKDGMMPPQHQFKKGSIEAIVFDQERHFGDRDDSGDEVNITVDAIEPSKALADEQMEPAVVGGMAFFLDHDR